MDVADVASMRASALKAELDERGVAWRGVAFEKAELVRLLEEACLAPPSAPPPPAPSPPPPAPSPPPTASAPPAADDAAERAAVAAMKVSEIKSELAQLVSSVGLNARPAVLPAPCAADARASLWTACARDGAV
jgi:hypothetical protein